MLEKDFFKFEDQQLETKADYTPKYQLTKVASDKYQFYSFEENKASLCTTRGALRLLASLRSGKCLDQNLSKKVIAMNNFDTITVAGSALKLGKIASGDKTGHEPWKLVAVNNVEYFVKADEDVEEKEVAKKVTASAHPTTHTYTIKIKAHNIREIAKIAECAESTLDAIPGTTQVPNQETISFDVNTQELPQEAQTNIEKALEHENVFLPKENVGVYNDCCPCGCGKAVHQETQIPEQVVPDVQDGMFVLVPLNSIKQSIASKVATLKSYASKHFSNYKIYDSAKKVVATIVDGKEQGLDPKSPTFGEELTAFLEKQRGLETTAEDQSKIVGIDGRVKNPGEDVQQGDTVISPDGKATKVTEVNASEDENNLVVEAAPENVQENTKAPEKEINKGETTSEQKEGTEVKRWKGMKEDQDSGKFIVYITESEERVFDDAQSAIDFMTRN